MDALQTALTDGSWIVAGVVIVMVFAVGTALYTRGSRARIPETPYGPRRGGDAAPGAEGSGSASGHDPQRDPGGDTRG